MNDLVLIELRKISRLLESMGTHLEKLSDAVWDPGYGHNNKIRIWDDRK